MGLTVIIPTHNEMRHGFLPKQLTLLSNLNNVNIIYVDGDSIDGTQEFIKQFPVKLHIVKTNSRAKRLNEGIKLAKTPMILLHHPRSILGIEAINYLVDNQEKLFWGGLTHRFDYNHYFLKLISWYSNIIRADMRKIFYLDHCVFVKKELLEKIGLIPEIDIFEDTELSYKLRKIAPAIRLPYLSITSAVRFKQNGIYKQEVINQFLKICFFLKVPHRIMNRFYEKKINLNSTYNREDL